MVGQLSVVVSCMLELLMESQVIRMALRGFAGYTVTEAVLAREAAPPQFFLCLNLNLSERAQRTDALMRSFSQCERQFNLPFSPPLSFFFFLFSAFGMPRAMILTTCPLDPHEEEKEEGESASMKLLFDVCWNRCEGGGSGMARRWKGLTTKHHSSPRSNP